VGGSLDSKNFLGETEKKGTLETQGEDSVFGKEGGEASAGCM